MNYQVIVKNNLATKQPIIKREYERRVTYKESSVTIEDILTTKIKKPKSDISLDCKVMDVNEYLNHLIRLSNRCQAYRTRISK